MNDPVRVALVADTHGFLDPRIESIARDCPVVVHAGDVGGSHVLDQLGASGARVVAVLGNNDTPGHWPSSDRERLATLPETTTLDLPGGELHVAHGHRLPARTRHRRLRAQAPHAAAIVVGHSHRRVVEFDPVPWILNPGAAGRSRAYGGPGCLVLTAAVRGWSIDVHAFDPLPRAKRR